MGVPTTAGSAKGGQKGGKGGGKAAMAKGGGKGGSPWGYAGPEGGKSGPYGGGTMPVCATPDANSPAHEWAGKAGHIPMWWGKGGGFEEVLLALRPWRLFTFRVPIVPNRCPTNTDGLHFGR